MMGTGRPLRTTRKISGLAERPGWYRIANTAGTLAKVTIYDEIGMLGVSADDLLRDLAGISGDIELHLNSPGGDVFDGIAIYNTLRQRDGEVGVVVDGLAASAASFIAQAASPGKLRMAPHSQMMIHDGFGMAIGNAADMRDMAALLDKASDNIARIYASRTGRDAGYWRDRMRTETWYDDHEAVAEGLADSVVGQERPRDKWDLSVYFNAPRNADGTVHPVMTGVHAHAHPDMDGGTHSHMHAHDGDNEHAPHGAPWDPDGDGDDDTHAETDTDHDHWTADGHPVTNQAPHRFRNWDASRAWAAGAAADNPAAFYRGICAGEKTTGDPDTQAHWALPHHYHPGDAPDPGGVSAALGRLNQTQGLKNPDAARAHLEAHERALGKDGSDNRSVDEVWMELAAALGRSEQ